MPTRKTRAATVDAPARARIPELDAIPAAAALSAGNESASDVPLGAVAAFLTPTEERREQELEEFLDAVGSEGRVRIWHVIDGKSVWAGEMSGEGFSLDALMESYGGGDKTLVFYQGRAARSRTRVSLDPTVPPTNPKAKRLAQTAPGVPAQPPLADVAAVLASMAQMSATAMANSQQMMTGMVTAMTAMMTARPERDPLDVAAKLLEVTRPGGSKSEVTEMFALFEKGMNVGKNLGGQEDATLGIVKEGLGVVAEVVKAQPWRHNPASAPVAVVGAVAARGGGSGFTGSAGGGVGALGDAGASGHGAPAGVAGGAMERVNARPWIAEAEPNRDVIVALLGRVQPPTVASAVADNLSDDAFSDLISDIEAGPTREAFVHRFAAAFDMQFTTPEAIAWGVAVADELIALAAPDDASDDDEPPAASNPPAAPPPA